jgi:hypothetical protein
VIWVQTRRGVFSCHALKIRTETSQQRDSWY